METSDFRSASGLHMVLRMKLVGVAILAMMVGTGCGVGADETYDGVSLVAATSQGLEQADVPPELQAATLPQTTATTGASPVRDTGTVALPQDPIPVFEGRPAGQPVTFILPVVRQGSR